MSDPPADRCAASSAARAEPLMATASRVRRWLVVEQPGPWGRRSPVDSAMADDVATALQGEAKRHGVRVLLARRPGWRRSPEQRTAFLAHTASASAWLERVTFDDPAELLDIDLALLGGSAAPGVGVLHDGELFLVCTNGRHDPCCADLGRPVVRALDTAGVADVWETTHVGGDRFAANIVCLPTGIYLGRVEPHGAAALLADVRRRVIPLDHYRGRSCFAPLVQAAEIFVRRALNERRLDALQPAGTVHVDEDQIVVRFARADQEAVEAHVRRVSGGAAALTCTSGGRLSRPWRYELVAMRSASST